MKNVLFNSVLVAFVLLVASCGKQPEAKVEVMSFNIRLDHVADSMNNWKYRKDNAAQMIAYYAPSKTDNAVAQYLELRGGWAARDYMSGMRNYSGKKTMQIISKFREIDAKSKGINNPNTSTGDLMKELIFFILH